MSTLTRDPDPMPPTGGLKQEASDDLPVFALPIERDALRPPKSRQVDTHTPTRSSRPRPRRRCVPYQAETRHNLQGEKVLLDQTIASIRALADEFALAEMHQLRVALHAEVHARGRNMIVASLEERSRKKEGDEVQASRIIFLRDALAARQAKLRAFKAWWALELVEAHFQRQVTRIECRLAA
ncbi:hypothetical protein C8F01DRAFT_1264508 [Mycena amicta]|nr:hypothetical protein C8F01DRAFT_1264508 [Mycena amicta]